MIVSFLNQKGGVGKTTLSINIARWFTVNGYRTLLIDSDPQRSAREWHKDADGELLNLIGLDLPTIDKDILNFEDQYEWIFIDGAPQLSTMAVKTIKCSNIVLIPVTPSGFDYRASGQFIELVKDRMDIDPYLKAYFIISRHKTGTSIGEEFRSRLEEFGLPILENKTFDRTIYSTSSALGKTIFEFSLNTSHAASLEIKGICEEIIQKGEEIEEVEV